MVILLASVEQGTCQPRPAGAPGSPPPCAAYAGVPEITPEWVAAHRQQVHLLDVRTSAELTGELGHLLGAQLIPLDELRARAAEVAKDKPVVAVCQTGKRAAMATAILSNAGVAQVANLAGGMVKWRELGLPS
ncbi:MAG TPA: rhodanese-like domain-containing protein [Polyangiaceae bacterium]